MPKIQFSMTGFYLFFGFLMCLNWTFKVYDDPDFGRAWVAFLVLDVLYVFIFLHRIERWWKQGRSQK